MKYIITGSKLDVIIDKYITDLIGHLKFKINPNNLENQRNFFIFYDKEIKNTNIKIDGTIGERCFINKDIWDGVSGLFGIDTHETEKVFKNWFLKHYNMSFKYFYSYDGEGNVEIG